MKEEERETLVKLRAMYMQKLRIGPFPTQECSLSGITGKLHGALMMYLADVAGIASHGVKLASLEDTRRTSFQKAVAGSFWDRYPDARRRITIEKTPVLFRLMANTEEARLLIKEYFDRQSG
jgi:hypothetical protein